MMTVSWISMSFSASRLVLAMGLKEGRNLRPVINLNRLHHR